MIGAKCPKKKFITRLDEKATPLLLFPSALACWLSLSGLQASSQPTQISSSVYYPCPPSPSPRCPTPLSCQCSLPVTTPADQTRALGCDAQRCTREVGSERPASVRRGQREGRCSLFRQIPPVESSQGREVATAFSHSPLRRPSTGDQPVRLAVVCHKQS